MTTEIRVGKGPNLDAPTSQELFEYFLGPLAPAWGLGEDAEHSLVTVVEKVIQSLEGLASSKAEKVHDTLREQREAWEWTVDWCFCKQTLDTIPLAVNRFLKLSPVLVKKTSSKEVNSYLREATRCYLWGFFQASVALMRAAIEAGLNERLKQKLHRVPEVDLVQKINQAARFKLISGESQRFAHEVRDKANKVVHGRNTSDQDAFDLLVKTRQTLLELCQE